MAVVAKDKNKALDIVCLKNSIGRFGKNNTTCYFQPDHLISPLFTILFIHTAFIFTAFSFLCIIFSDTKIFYMTSFQSSARV